jgi:hypothetical protein
MAHRFKFTFANALVVASGGTSSATTPEGYSVRRARPDEARHIARLHEETLAVPARAKDLEAMWRGGDARVFVAERQRYAVGFIVAQVRDRLSARASRHGVLCGQGRPLDHHVLGD